MSNTIHAVDSEQLLNRARQGDREALSRLLVEQKTFISIIVSRFVWDKENARDVVQNVFVKIIRGIGEFSGQSKFTTWIYRLAINECIDYSRRRTMTRDKVQELVEPDEVLAPDARDCYAKMEDVYLRQEVAAALQPLPLETQAAFKLFYFGGHSGKEGAEILKISEPNFYMKIKAARDAVRKHLLAGGWGEEQSPRLSLHVASRDGEEDSED